MKTKVLICGANNKLCQLNHLRQRVRDRSPHAASGDPAGLYASNCSGERT
jgi:hypothetical protein